MTEIIFATNLKRIRESKNMSKAELARRVGVSDVTVGHWEIGKISPRMGKIEAIADVLGVTTDELVFGITNDVQPVISKQKTVSLYGSIAAGVPIEMLVAEDQVEIPQSLIEQYPNAFMLKIMGDSMSKIIPNGAYALIQPCSEVCNGEVAAVAINGENATLKRFYNLQNTVILEPDSYSPEHTTQAFEKNINETTTVRVLGKLVWFMSPYNTKY